MLEISRSVLYITVMGLTNMTNKVIFVLLAITIGLSVMQLVDNNNSVDEVGLANSKQIETNINKLVDLKQDSGDLYYKIAEINSVFSAIFDKIDLLEKQSDMSNFEARLLIAENGIRTLSNNQIEIPTHESEMTDFNLVLLNNDSIVQKTYGVNDVVYITGDAGVTVHPTISMKVRDNDGNLLLAKEFAISSEGRFTSIYQVPNLDAGVYTITITDGTIVDSITFVVE